MSTLVIDINAKYGIDGQDFLINGDAAIAQALRRMLTMQATSRFMRPQMASPIWNHLHRPMTEDNAFFLFVAVLNLIETNEPRIRVDRRHCRITADLNSNKYHVLITYINLQTREAESLTFAFAGSS